MSEVLLPDKAVVHKFLRQFSTENCQTAQVFCIAQIYVVAPPKRALSNSCIGEIRRSSRVIALAQGLRGRRCGAIWLRREREKSLWQLARAGFRIGIQRTRNSGN